jgi:hypothetical protein
MAASNTLNTMKSCSRNVNAHWKVLHQDACFLQLKVQDWASIAGMNLCRTKEAVGPTTITASIVARLYSARRGIGSNVEVGTSSHTFLAAIYSSEKAEGARGSAGSGMSTSAARRSAGEGLVGRGCAYKSALSWTWATPGEPG